MKKKAATCLTIILSVVLALSAVSTAAVAEERVKINFWGWGSEWQDYIDNFYKQYPDTEFDIVYRDHGTDYQLALDIILASQTGEEYPDLFCAEANDVAKYANSDYSMKLADAFPDGALDQKLEAAGIAPYVTALGSDAQGNLKGLAFQNAVGMVYYRRSILKEYMGTDDPEEVAAYVKDLDTMIETMRTIGEKSSGKYAGLSTAFLASRAYFGLMEKPLLSEGKIQLEDGVLRYISDMKMLFDEGLLNLSGWAAPAMFNDMAGTSERPNVFFFGPPWLLGITMRENAGDTKGDWGATYAPMDYTLGGTWLMIGSATQHLDLCARFMDYFALDTSEKGQCYFVATNGDCPTSAAVVEKFAQSGYTNEVAGGQDTLSVFIKASSRITPDSNCVKNWQSHSAACTGYMLSAVQAWCNGEVSSLLDAVQLYIELVQGNYDVEAPDDVEAIVAAYEAKAA